MVSLVEGPMPISPEVLLVSPTTDSLVMATGRPAQAPTLGANILASRLAAVGVESLVLDELTMQTAVFYRGCTWGRAVLDTLETYPSIRMVGFSVLTNFRSTAALLTRMVRKQYPDIMISWGGTHVNCMGAALHGVYHGLIDVLVFGQASNAVVYALRSLLRKGIRPEEIIMMAGDNGYQDEYSMLPDYRAYLPHLNGKGLPRLIFRSSSGCPSASCTFCSAHFLEGNYQCFPESSVRKSIRQAQAYSPQRFEFHDQDLFCNLERVMNILDPALFSAVPESYAHANIHSFDERAVDLLTGFSCHWKVFFGLETVSSRLRESIGKPSIEPHRLDWFRKVAQRTAGSRVRIGLFLLVGIPGEMREDIERTVDYVRELGDVDVCISPLKVCPGTRLAETMAQKGQIDPRIWLDEDGPEVVTAVTGERLAFAIESWQYMLEVFPPASTHNTIDRHLLGVRKE